VTETKLADLTAQFQCLLTSGPRNSRPTRASTGQTKLSDTSSRLDQFLVAGSLQIHELNVNGRKDLSSSFGSKKR
jgi:hypothetical protein